MIDDLSSEYNQDRVNFNPFGKPNLLTRSEPTQIHKAKPTENKQMKVEVKQ